MLRIADGPIRYYVAFDEAKATSGGCRIRSLERSTTSDRERDRSGYCSAPSSSLGTQSLHELRAVTGLDGNEGGVLSWKPAVLIGCMGSCC